MPENKKITRRDAMKLLGAVVGASVLANLPSKWKSPSIVQGVLPAHAQTSCGTGNDVFVEILIATGGETAFVIQQGPPPDITTGTLGAEGSTYRWNCRTGCLQILFGIDNASLAQIRVTTVLNVFTHNLDFVNGPDFVTILINFDTGAHALNGDPTVLDCEWVPLPD